jgi:1-phosphofructokinase family hexose kinase
VPTIKLTVIQALGGDSIALGLLGGHTGDLWRAEASRRGLKYDMVQVSGESRESFCLIDLDEGNVVESVEEGPSAEGDCLQFLLGTLDRYLPHAEMLILSGSLPPGLPSDSYVQMIQLAHRHGVRTLADLHGNHLSQVLEHRPSLIKPSLAEFDELIGRETSNIEERALACQSLYHATGVVIALSMSADGLLVTGPEGQWRLRPPNVEMHLPGGRGRNVIGCGDALVGALAYEYTTTQDLLAASKLGLAAAHYNLGTFGVPEIEARATRRLVEAIDLETM